MKVNLIPGKTRADKWASFISTNKTFANCVMTKMAADGSNCPPQKIPGVIVKLYKNNSDFIHNDIRYNGKVIDISGALLTNVEKATLSCMLQNLGFQFVKM